MTENASKNDKPPFTHTAWILKTELIRKGRRVGRWIDEGVARVEPDGSINVYLHSLPIGGFDGRIHLAAIGANPPDIMPAPPQRPGDTVGEDDAEE
jgi:hypothetical protein